MKMFKRLFMANVKEFIRDRSGLFWTFAFPILFIFIFGAIFGGDDVDMQFQIGLTGAESVMYEEMKADLENQENMQIFSGSPAEELEALERGERNLVIVLPEMAEDLSGDGEERYEIEMYYDEGSNPILNQQLVSSFERGFMEAEDSILDRERLLETRVESVQAGGGIDDFDYILPGILAMALMQLGLFGSIQFLDLREKEIIRSLSVTPLSRGALLSSEIGLRLIIGILQMAIIVTIGSLVFGVSIASSPLAVLGVVILGSLTFVSLGYMLISFVSSAEGGRNLIQVVQFPMLFLSGIFFPIETMPDYTRPIVRMIPLTYLGDALRQLMVGVRGTYPLYLNLAVLAVWFVVTSLLAVKFWRWE